MARKPVSETSDSLVHTLASLTGLDPTAIMGALIILGFAVAAIVANYMTSHGE